MSKKKVQDSLLFANVAGDFSKLTSEILFNTAKCRDELSLALVDEIGRLNAIGYANVINAYDTSLITVGGSVALQNKKLVMDPILKYVKCYTVNRIPKIMITPLAEDIGIYGAITAVVMDEKWLMGDNPPIFSD